MATATRATSRPLEDEPAQPSCFHCGEPCRDLIEADEKAFCCIGCCSVYQLLNNHQLDSYYRLDRAPGARPTESSKFERFAYLDDPAAMERILDFQDGSHAMVTFRVPAIHCVACIWLLENLYKLEPAISRTQVNFPRKELLIHFDQTAMTLRGLVTFLAKLGYEPQLSLETLEKRRKVSPNRALYIKVGIAGFCFANIMLLSFPSYFHIDQSMPGNFEQTFAWLTVVLSLPVLFYGASDYLAAAVLAVRRRVVTIDLPIALGIVAFYVHSLLEIVTGTGAGYLDSFAGLIFFMLLGRIFQNKTYDILSFDRDYTSYFPIHVMRLDEADQEASIPLNRLEVGNRIIVRHHELIPADTSLLSPQAKIDYSFVTGESDPVARHQGETVFAGGRHLGEAGIYQIVRPVSRSHLTQLWNNPIFEKDESRDLTSLTNRVSKHFTMIVIAIAVTAAAWWLRTDVGIALRVFTAVLIIACPCALALSAPFTLGTVIRLLERRRCFAKNAATVEALARINTIVFDKTGTLTTDQGATVEWQGKVGPEEQMLAKALSRHSTHPLSVRLTSSLADLPVLGVSEFTEQPGEGLEGRVQGKLVRLGSATWTGAPELTPSPHPTVDIAIDGEWRGRAVLQTALRPGLPQLVEALRKRRLRIILLSGDTNRQSSLLHPVFGDDAELHFNQTPVEKLDFVRRLQENGGRVLMIGDGLNDAGALRQSDVGIAVSDDLSAFSPACDAILAGDQLPHLDRLLTFTRRSIWVIVCSFTISFLYNVIGISLAVQALLEPWIAAVLMPLSSITVITFAVLTTRLVARRTGLGPVE